MNHPRPAIIALGLSTAMFGAAIAARDLVDPWWSNAIAAALTIAIAIPILRPGLADLLRVRARGLILAGLLGVALVMATHLGFAITNELLPGLAADVERLYRDIGETSPGQTITLAIIVFSVAAEELMWRGVAVALCQHHLPGKPALVAAIGLYAAPQLIGGPWILVVAALVVGTVFTAQRVVTGRLTEPLVSHAIWSVAIFNLAPLTN